jgi:hypothetical protein
MIATYRGNTYETNTKEAQERKAPVLTYRGVKYATPSVTPCRACLAQSAD